MPIIWRYLLKNYLTAFIGLTIGLLLALFVIRFREIAEFMTLIVHVSAFCKFVLSQFFYILPISLPISCMISSLWLFRKMSHNQELTVLRASGMSFWIIVTPIFIIGFCISCCNAMLLSEIGPRSRFLTKKLIYETTINNPLSLLNKLALAQFPNGYIQMQIIKGCNEAKDTFFIYHDDIHRQSHMVYAKNLRVQNDQLKGEQISYICSRQSEQENQFDHLMIETQEIMTLETSLIKNFLKKTNRDFNPEYLSLKEIVLYLKKGKDLDSKPYLLEIARRLSLSLAPLILTLLGIGCGLNTQRMSSKRGSSIGYFLLTLYLASFIGGKSLKHSLPLALCLYFVPLIIILGFTMRQFSRFIKGTL